MIRFRVPRERIEEILTCIRLGVAVPSEEGGHWRTNDLLVMAGVFWNAAVSAVVMEHAAQGTEEPELVERAEEAAALIARLRDVASSVREGNPLPVHGMGDFSGSVTRQGDGSVNLALERGPNLRLLT